MNPWLDDGDVRLYLGDAIETLRTFDAESIDCVVTSPPYWGLRDYGTGSWEGGDPDCEHRRFVTPAPGERGKSTLVGSVETQRVAMEAAATYRDVCGKCGAQRFDRQIGMEDSPDGFVAAMVAVFREVRRVLAPHGTVWLNLGDSYAGTSIVGRSDVARIGGALDGPNPTTGPGSKYADTDALTPQPRPAVKGLKTKDLVGIPWRSAFALQADGWWLRSDIVWAKPNPMPESVTDRPTKSHEYVFLLTKRDRYWFDAEAIAERSVGVWNSADTFGNSDRYPKTATMSDRDRSLMRTRGMGTHHDDVKRIGRNPRSVWSIPTRGYSEAHFATFPEELPRRAILAGCPLRVCRTCGLPSERIFEETGAENDRLDNREWRLDGNAAQRALSGQTYEPQRRATDEWTDCGHDDWRRGVVLDPFAGSGTVAKVARDHMRNAVGIDLSEEYLALARRRLQQLSLFQEGVDD